MPVKILNFYIKMYICHIVSEIRGGGGGGGYIHICVAQYCSYFMLYYLISAVCLHLTLKKCVGILASVHVRVYRITLHLALLLHIIILIMFEFTKSRTIHAPEGRGT